MSAGSAASNLGYAKIIPNSNINNNFVNKDNSHYPGGFGSNETSNFLGLVGAKSNINAAASYIPGMSGGGKKLKKKIKNITKRYRMSKKGLKHRVSKMKRKIQSTLSKSMAKTLARSKSRNIARSIAGGKKTKKRGGNPFAAFRVGKYFYNKSKKQPTPQMSDTANAAEVSSNMGQTGGYSQYQNNYPSTPTYSTGGFLSAQNLGLANPVPYKLLSNDTNNIDNYNHFTMKGFPSRGH
jgi:hypothetical protein